ncbi:MAG: hypothetical protein ACREGC_00005 [Minisyncoccia bacterium]
MPGQFTRTRQQQIVNFQSGALVISNQLGLGMLYRELALTLDGAITSGNTSNTYGTTTLLGGDEWKLISKIEIVVNGGDTIRSMTGEELYMWNAFIFNRPPRRPTLTTSSASFDTTLILPFWDYRSISPVDSLLDSSKLSDLRVQVTWGTADSMTSFTGNTFTTNPTLTITSRESYGLKGRFSVNRQFRITNPAAVTTQKGYQFLMPLGNIYKGFFINTKDLSGDDLANCIDRFQLVSGTNVFVDTNFKTIRDWQTMRKYQINDVATNTTPTIQPLAISNKSLFDAWTYVDLIDDGYLTEAIDTYKLPELKILLDVNQTINTITIIPDQIIPIRGATNKAGGK